jgi:hypothetical protein
MAELPRWFYAKQQVGIDFADAAQVKAFDRLGIRAQRWGY